MMLKPRALCGEKVVRERKLSDDEVFAFTRAARRMSYPWRPIYQLLLLTGLRLNEVCDARWDEIDLKNGTWVIPAARMKGRNGRARPHAVPLTPEIRAIIDSLPEFRGGEYLFSTTYGRTPAWVSHKVKQDLDALMLRTLKAMARKRGDDPRKVKLEHGRTTTCGVSFARAYRSSRSLTKLPRPSWRIPARAFKASMTSTTISMRRKKP